jgi:GNAT superfamily N-acetyltransferase
VTLVGTLEAARGRGLATLLMRRALADARERGCTTTTLVATKMGHPIYARLGYRDFGRVQMWERRKPGPAAAA